MEHRTSHRRHASALTQSDSLVRRRAYLDVLKIIVIGGVIAGHAWAGYTEIGGWAYSDIRETSLSPVAETVAEALLGPFGLFAMGLLFLVSGLLTVSSLERKGAGRFALDRLVRLGAPLAVFTFVLWPPVRAGMERLAGLPITPWWVPDPVHLWFLEVLVIFSVGAAVWWRLSRRHRVPGTPEQIVPRAGPAPGKSGLTLGHLALLAAGITAGSFIARLWWPLGSDGPFALHLCQWAQFIALFGLGIAAARRGWLDPVPERLSRRCGRAAVIGVLAVGVVAVIAALSGVPTADFLGGPHPAALVVAAAEGLLAATVPVWLLGWAQRHLDGVRGAEPVARTAYAAFLLQGHVLVGLAVVLRPFDVPAEVKAALVSVVGVAVCFGLGSLLTKHTPLGRVL